MGLFCEQDKILQNALAEIKCFSLWNCGRSLGYGQLCFDSFVCERGGVLAGFI